MEQFANTHAPTLFTQLLNSITNLARLSAAVSEIEPVLTPEINQSIPKSLLREDARTRVSGGYRA